jgi:hypothetical protein
MPSPQEELTDAQQNALHHVKATAKTLAAAAKPRLVSRLANMGIDDADAVLQNLLIHLRDRVPIIIHVPLHVLNLLIDDPVYRSQFETNTSMGTLSHDSRRQWEACLFGCAYNGAPDAERVKYGCLSTISLPSGVASCASVFGVAVLVLKDSVRERVTVTIRDRHSEPFGTYLPLGTLAHCAHLLDHFHDAEIVAMRDLAVGKAPHTVTPSNFPIKEIHVHGPILMREHIEQLARAWNPPIDSLLSATIDKVAAKSHSESLHSVPRCSANAADHEALIAKFEAAFPGVAITRF